MSLAELHDAFDALSADDQLRLVHELWDRVASNAARLPAPQWHLEELEQRMAEHAAAPDDVVSWTDVVARARSRR